MAVDRGLLGWGLFLVVLGAVPLLVNAGLVDRAALPDPASGRPGRRSGSRSRRTPAAWSSIRTRAAVAEAGIRLGPVG